AGLPYYMSPGNHDVGFVAGESTDRGQGLRNYLAAMTDLVPRDGNLRRLDGYPTYAFAYGNTFLLALDSNIAADERQFEWARKQLEGLDRARFKHVITFF